MFHYGVKIIKISLESTDHAFQNMPCATVLAIKVLTLCAMVYIPYEYTKKNTPNKQP